ncbi:MAG: patatin-like phospholipase family protein [Candidatus Omnitrophica bacterium]|nr:patatin-like phospholipase family protein [Candidatus Omnitrophota bacterium]
MSVFRLFKKKKRKVTLVLGGGSARGLAHIGVLGVFKEKGIPIDNIVGTSMGALVGASYSVGVSLKEMYDLAENFTVNQLLDPTIPRMGLLAGKKLEAMIRQLTHGKGFKDCKIPLAVVTTDIQNGEEVVLQEGDLVKAIQASCSWPGIFNPVEIDGRILVDGGIKDSVPTSIARSLGADYVLAVDVGFCVKDGKIENIFQMILQSFQIMGEELNQYQSKGADFTLKVELGNLDQVSFDRAHEAMMKGAAIAMEKIPAIMKDLGL